MRLGPPMGALSTYPGDTPLKTASAFLRGHQLSLDLSLGWELVSSSPPHAGTLPGLACAGPAQSSTAAVCSRLHWSRQVTLLRPPPPASGSCSLSAFSPAVAPELWKRRDNDVAFAVEHPLTLFL